MTDWRYRRCVQALSQRRQQGSIHVRRRFHAGDGAPQRDIRRLKHQQQLCLLLTGLDSLSEENGSARYRVRGARVGTAIESAYQEAGPKVGLKPGQKRSEPGPIPAGRPGPGAGEILPCDRFFRKRSDRTYDKIMSDFPENNRLQSNTHRWTPAQSPVSLANHHP